MKVPFILVMVIVSEAMADSKSLPVIRHADLQIIARMLLPYVNLRNRVARSDFQGNTGGGTGVQAKNRSYKAPDRHSDEDDDNVTVDIGLTDFDDEEILIPGSVSRRIITGSETYHDKRRFDDYGHMRFGRSDPTANKKFDDYGHMRFGK